MILYLIKFTVGRSRCTIIYHDQTIASTMGVQFSSVGVLPSTQPVATFGSSFILSIQFSVPLMWLARVVYLLHWLVLLRGGAGGRGMLILVVTDWYNFPKGKTGSVEPAVV